ncbi:MAG TPA: DNA methyltransferase [Candidatus Saccharimonadales bacterium]|jgi:putative DNA methylase|nr:DNA methyltransferase [Candidatus Saccharimonadales bacterium]
MGLGKSYPLFVEPTIQIGGLRDTIPGTSAIEDCDFPFEFVSEVAEAESWRKEVHRPTYHLHKWWAQRLGSIFRAIIIAANSPAGADIRRLFYERVDLEGVTVFDPFMGSGTTLGETIKAGGRAIGRDINPVAYSLVRNALSLPLDGDLKTRFAELEQSVSHVIHGYYQALIGSDRVPVLYYFWVKQVPCVQCGFLVDLFASRIFAKHAYPQKNPRSQCTCPGCGAINAVRFDSCSHLCESCGQTFDPQKGNVAHDQVTCPRCESRFRVIEAASRLAGPPPHRLYAKLALDRLGNKCYLPADDFDLDLYAKAERELAKTEVFYPQDEISPGHNTNQVLRYNYTHWHQMFNARQLLCLGYLAKKISEIEDPHHKDLFCCLFSGALEFNNMFASFKGEGTGAVRHMFSHHILKPERLPLEANPWGTTKSSGAFSTLFRSRILRAVEYAHNPYEIRVAANQDATKVYGICRPVVSEIATSYAEFSGKNVYLSCGPSQHTDIFPGSVDVVVTDPPFFDNVHYSELADFFHVWQRLVQGGANGAHERATTRSVAEVQSGNQDQFMTALRDVWKECHRVLKDNGLLVFTYHHSRQEGWSALLKSLTNAKFVITAVHPVKSEMSVAAPKAQSKEPINIDIIIVCRKRPEHSLEDRSAGEVLAAAHAGAHIQLQRLNVSGRFLGKGDTRVIFMANLLKLLSQSDEPGPWPWQVGERLESAVEELFLSQSPPVS